jgi:hypothetical protein
MKYLKVVYELLAYLLLAILGATTGTLLLHHVLEVYYV